VLPGSAAVPSAPAETDASPRHGVPLRLEVAAVLAAGIASLVLAAMLT